MSFLRNRNGENDLDRLEDFLLGVLGSFISTVGSDSAVHTSVVFNLPPSRISSTTILFDLVDLGVFCFLCLGNGDADLVLILSLGLLPLSKPVPELVELAVVPESDGWMDRLSIMGLLLFVSFPLRRNGDEERIIGDWELESLRLNSDGIDSRLNACLGYSLCDDPLGNLK